MMDVLGQARCMGADVFVPPPPPYVLIVSGCRDITDRVAFEGALIAALAALGGSPRIVHLFEGGAAGVDTLAREWAQMGAATTTGITAAPIPTSTFRADWKKHGRAAGPIRNSEMILCAIRMAKAYHAEPAFLAIWDGVSRGTASAIELAISIPALQGRRFVFGYDRTRTGMVWPLSLAEITAALANRKGTS